MKRLLLFLMVGLWLFPASVFAVEPQLSELCETTWEGYYFYPATANAQQERAPVRFEIRFTCSGNTIIGRLSEPNTFGDTTSSHLYANLSAITIRGQKFEFTKTYDGTAGVSHNVYYSGDFKTNRFISGVWKIPQKDGSVYSGNFEMHR